MPDIDDTIDWQLVEQYLAGECSPTDEARLQAWIATDPSRERLLGGLERTWAAAAGAESHRYDADVGWRELHEKLERPIDITVRSSAHRGPLEPKPPTWRQALVRVAAVLAIAAAGAAVTQTVQSRRESGADAIAMREVTTARGQRAIVRLADGSRVVLGPGSHLAAPERFDRNTRAVTLLGEGFFEIARDEDRPFLIRSGRAVTRVLGTSFGLRAYADDPEVRVVVKTGRLRFRGTDERDSGAELTRGQIGRLDGSGEVTVDAVADIDAYLGWLNDKLIFKDTPLTRVAADLERWYDVEVTITDTAIAAFPLTATFDHQPLDEVLTVIERSLDVRYAREGRAVGFAAMPAASR